MLLAVRRSGEIKLPEVFYVSPVLIKIFLPEPGYQCIIYPGPVTGSYRINGNIFGINFCDFFVSQYTCMSKAQTIR